MLTNYLTKELLMSRPPINLQYLLDKTAIQEVITRYFQGLDRCLADQVRSCLPMTSKRFMTVVRRCTASST